MTLFSDDYRLEITRETYTRPSHRSGSGSRSCVMPDVGDKLSVMKYMLWVLVFHLVLTFSAAGQAPTLSFKHLTSAQGLSQHHVYCIFQDHQGFIWFGTQDGVNKFDGYTFRVYKNDPRDRTSISGNFVRSIFEDSNKDLWFGSMTGLSRYDRMTDSFVQFRHDPNNPKSISHSEITAIYQDKLGILWVATVGGLNQFNEEDNTFTRFTHNANDPNGLGDNFVWAIYEDKRGNLWIGTIRGLHLYDRKSNTFKRYMPDKANPNSISHERIHTLLEDRNGNLWIGTGGGLNLFDRDAQTFKHFKHDSTRTNSIPNDLIFSMYEDRKGNLWVGSWNAGLSWFDPKSETFTTYVHDPYDPHSLSNNTPSAIFEDRSGTLWVGVHRGGINYYNPDQHKFKTYRARPGHNGLSNNNIKSFVEDKLGRIWISTDGGALNLFDRNKNTFTHYIHDPSNPGSVSNGVLSILMDRQGNLWVGAPGMLDMFDSKRNRFIHYSYEPHNVNTLSLNNIWYILEDHNGNLWISEYDKGFFVFDQKEKKIRTRPYQSTFNLNADNIRVIFQDSDHMIWIGTFRGGLNRLDPSTNQITRFEHNENDTTSLSSNEVLSIFEDNQKRLWVGTRSGLNLFDSERKSFTVFKQKHGLPNDVIQSIIQDDKGDIWMGTLQGLTRLNPESGKFKTYTEADGLQGNEFTRGSCLKAKDGMLFFGGINGFSTFYPDSIKESTFIPPVYITDFQIFNKPVAISQDSPLKTNINEAKEIVLSHEASVFSFEFAALNYLSPEKNSYAYKLDGFDREWNYVGNKRSATYTNLDPGTYYFNVKASNNDGLWNETGTTLKIVVTPPFWKTWWFQTLGAVAFGGILLAIYKIRVSGIKKQKRALEFLVQQRTEEIASQNEQLWAQQKELEEQNKTIEEKNTLLENQQQHLEKLVEERTLELLQMNMELKDKNQRLEQYGFMTSHNFRGPVASLLGLINVFNKENPADPDNTVYMEKMAETTLKIDEMIKDMSILLDQETHIENLYENVLLNDVVQNVNVLLAREIQESNVRITHDFSAAPMVRGVPAYINSMFYNLISNAIKFRKEEEQPHIEIKSKQADNLVSISFKDNGAGIDMEKHATSIFHPFKRFQPNIPGKGLGLYLVKTQLKAMNGDIRIESEKGKGTTFMLVFKTET